MLAFTLSFLFEVIFKVFAFISNKSFLANIVPLGSIILTSLDEPYVAFGVRIISILSKKFTI